MITVTIEKINGVDVTALGANDLVITKWYPCIYDGTNIQVLDL